jgi:hypothetical protein
MNQMKKPVTRNLNPESLNTSLASGDTIAQQ